MPIFGRKKPAKATKVKKAKKINVQQVVDCSNCNKKYTHDGNDRCVACRQV